MEMLSLSLATTRADKIRNESIRGTEHVRWRGGTEEGCRARSREAT